MTTVKSKDKVQGRSIPSNTSEPTQIIFTIRNGSLHLSSKHNEDSESISDSLKDLPFENLKPRLEEGEVYIEIIRNNADLFEEHCINNISSAYEAFWKGDFQSCIERRSCMKCGQVFLTPRQLLHHLQNLHEILSPEECFVCHKFFSNRSERLTHLIQSHHLYKPDSTCEVCLKVFNCEMDKKNHQLLHAEKSKCKWCADPFPCEYLLNCHLQHCSLRRNDLDCHICGCHFRSSHILQLHSLRHSRVTCEICQFSLLSVSGTSLEDPELLLVQHLKNTHTLDDISNILKRLKKRDEEEENLDKLFMNQIEENLSQLNDSIKQTLSEKELSHNSVDSFHEAQQQEIIAESSVTNWQCTQCFKKFECVEELIKHELNHENPFSCSVCCLEFSHRRGFKRHMRTHGIHVKPDSVRYKCKQCSVHCATMSALRLHLLTHTDQKPHLCDKCGLKFRRPHALKAHEHTVHNSRMMHHCPQCDTSSLSRSSLLRHIQCVHGGVRRFICGVCGTRCLQNQGLRRHLKNVHKLDFPPMESLSKKSNSEIHVIPPAENLAPTDPLVSMLKFAVREEQLKLDLLKKQRRTDKNTTDGSHQPSESSIDGQSLNILGDVASKAAPLQQINGSTHFIQPSVDQKLQEASTFLCAGCGHNAESLNDLSLHVTQCQHGKTLSFIDEGSSVISGKPAVVFSLASSFSTATSTIASGIPYQVCVVNGQLVPGAVSLMGHPVLPSLNGGSVSSHTAAPTGTSDTNLTCLSVPTSKVGTSESGGLNENISITGGLLTDLNESSKLSSDIVTSDTLESSNSYQLELLDSSTFSFQEDYLIREETSKAICNINHSDASFISQTNSISFSSCDILENSKQTGVYSFNHDSQQNILSAESNVNISQLPAKQIENEVSTLLSDHSKILNVSNQCVPSISAPSHQQVVHPVSSVFVPSVSVGSAISNHRGAEKLQSRKKLLPNSYANAESSFDLTKPVPDSGMTPAGSTQGHNVASENNPSAEECQNAPTGNLETLLQTCPECGKQLSSASAFKRHLEVHFGGKSHQCSECGKCFRYKCNLTVHVRSHTGVRPFECTVCGKTFRYQSELKEHRQLHNGSKTFKCLECGQLFARKRDLRRHSLSHQNSGKPTCHICGKTFSRSDYLKRHIKAHKSSDPMDVESLQDPKASQSEKVSTNKYCKKTSCLEKTTNVCKAQPTDLSHLNHKKVLQNNRKKTPKESQKPSRKTALPTAEAQPRNNHATASSQGTSSDDLISLAYQAAEDGVEFMFVEEIGTGTQSKEVEICSTEVDNNVIYVQIMESTQVNN